MNPIELLEGAPLWVLESPMIVTVLVTALSNNLVLGVHVTTGGSLVVSTSVHGDSLTAKAAPMAVRAAVARADELGRWIVDRGNYTHQPLQPRTGAPVGEA